MRKETRPSYPRRNKKPLCLVITGEMNPPTLAHVRVADSCADFMARATGRQVRVMFAPSCQASVEKIKSRRPDAVVFPEPMRADMLMKLVEANGLDAGITNCDLGEDQPSGMAEMLGMLKESDPSMDYMPCVSMNRIKSFARTKDYARILADYGLMVAVKDAHRCRDGHGLKQDMRDMIENDEALAPYSSRIYITDRTDLDEMPNSSSNARSCIAAGDYDGASRECGYYVTKMIEAYMLTRKYVPERDWYCSGE